MSGFRSLVGPVHQVKFEPKEISVTSETCVSPTRRGSSAGSRTSTLPTTPKGSFSRRTTNLNGVRFRVGPVRQVRLWFPTVTTSSNTCVLPFPDETPWPLGVAQLRLGRLHQVRGRQQRGGLAEPPQLGSPHRERRGTFPRWKFGQLLAIFLIAISSARSRSPT